MLRILIVTYQCSKAQRAHRQRPPEERHDEGCLAAQCLTGQHAIFQHAHRIGRLGAFRHIHVDIAVLVRANQQVAAALSIADLAVVLVVTLDHQIRIFHIAAFKGDEQILADALGRDVLRAKTGGLIGEVVVHIGLSQDAYRLALGTRTAFATDDLLRLDGFIRSVDAQSDVLDTHDMYLSVKRCMQKEEL